MWIKKKDYEALMNRIDGLENDMRIVGGSLSDFNISNDDVTKQLKLLENAHSYSRDIGIWGSIINERYEHPSEKVNTNKIKDITLQELAEYVIDNKPIKRNETIIKEYYNDRDEIKIEL